MKVLLVNPYIYDFTAFDFWLRPLGLLYIAAVLKKYTDCEIYWLDVLDRFQEGMPVKRSHADGSGKFHKEIVEKPAIYEKIPRNYSRYGIPFDIFKKKVEQLPQVDMILVTGLMTYWLDGVTVTIKALREKFPAAKVVMGGILPTLVPADQLKNHIDADYYVEGYGETRILEIIKENNGAVLPYPDFSDIDNLPFPAVDYLSSRDSLPLMTSRGCPFRCTYCASNLLNKGFLERRPEKILEEIYFMHETYGTRHFAIFDDALLINKRKRFLKVFQEVKESIEVSFHTPNGLHVGEIDRETADLMFESGFKTLRLSFESTTEEILSRSSGKVTVNQMVKAVENLEAAGYERKNLGVYLLFGLRGQKVNDLEAAFDFVRDLGVATNLSYYSPVPGTVDFRELQKTEVLATPVNLYETNKIYFLYEKSGFSLDDIRYIKDKVSTYTREIKGPDAPAAVKG
ncbi:MAG: radical SAM protein, partial [bacterium]|nr:radical SAM protein [bacterium]